MQIDQAKVINHQIVRCSLGAMGFDGHEGECLPSCSLKEMLEASEIMASYTEQNEDGTTTRFTRVHPRWIAARYAFEQFGNSPYQLLEALGYEVSHA